jgi:hypothetical protein
MTLRLDHQKFIHKTRKVLMDSRVEEQKQAYERDRKERDCNVPVWEDVGYFVFRRAYNFVGGTLRKDNTAPLGSFTKFGDVYSGKPKVALNKCASALLGMVWKNGARTFKVKMPKSVSNTRENKEFYDRLNYKTIKAMEHPKARFVSTAGEDIREMCGFGQGGIGVFLTGDTASPLVYKSYTVKNCTLIENEEGYIEGCYIEETLSRADLIKKYGDAAKPKKGLSSGKDLNTEMVTYLHVVRPNPNFKEGSLNASDFEYMSLHFELKDGHILRDSGFHENPIAWSRLEKCSGETYSRSPAIDLLPDIYELNEAIRQFYRGSEKDNDPPKALLDDGAYGGGVIDLSPKAFNVLDVSGRQTGNPIVDLHTPVNRQYLLAMIENLKQEIYEGYYLDQILDLNNEKRQTLGEAEIRNEIRSEPLASILVRILEEKYIPVVETSISLLFQIGEIGVLPGSDQQKMAQAVGKEVYIIPEEVASLIKAGDDFYELQFISPAARIMRAEELRGLKNAIGLSVEIREADPKPLMRYNMEKVIDLVNELEGVPDSVMLSDEDYKAEVQAFYDREATMAGIEANAIQAKIAKDSAAAAQSEAQATAIIQGGNGILGANGNPSGV